jgi:hypothetical protein
MQVYLLERYDGEFSAKLQRLFDFSNARSRGSPHDAHLHLMHAFSKIQPPHSIMDNLSHNDRIELAIAELESQTQSNFAATARKYNLKRITLSRRFKGETDSKENAVSYALKAFTNVEKDVLMRYINNLNARELPPTSQIIKNFAEEIANKNLKSNWTIRFLQRKKKIIRSVYLTTINYKRKISDNSYHYKHFFTNVRLRFLYIICYI